MTEKLILIIFLNGNTQFLYFLYFLWNLLGYFLFLSPPLLCNLKGCNSLSPPWYCCACLHYKISRFVDIFVTNSNSLQNSQIKPSEKLSCGSYCTIQSSRRVTTTCPSVTFLSLLNKVWADVYWTPRGVLLLLLVCVEKLKENTEEVNVL